MPVSVRYNYRLIENRWKIRKSETQQIKAVLGLCPDDLPENYGWDSIHMYVLYRYKGRKLNWNEDEIAGIHDGLNRLYCLITEQLPLIFPFQEDGGKDMEEFSLSENVPGDTGGGTGELPEQRIPVSGTAAGLISSVSAGCQARDYNAAVSDFIKCCKRLKREIRKPAAGGEGEMETKAFSLFAMIYTLALPAPNLFSELRQMFVQRSGRKLWETFEGRAEEIENGSWPEKTFSFREGTVIPVQLNGNVKAHIRVTPDMTREEAVRLACTFLDRRMENKKIKKVIYLPGRIISLVTEDR